MSKQRAKVLKRQQERCVKSERNEGMAAGFSEALRSNALASWFEEFRSGKHLSPSYPELLTMAEVLGMASDELMQEWQSMDLSYPAGK